LSIPGQPKSGQTAAGAPSMLPVYGVDRDPVSMRTISPSRMCRILLAMDAASGPLNRTIPMPPRPGGVETAAMVSVMVSEPAIGFR